MRGRKIFGALVPYDEIWCPGANWATSITSLDAGLEIGSMKLQWGSYSIWVLPAEKEWQAVINSDSKAFHLDHEPDKDIGRIKMNLKTLDQPVESLTFEIRSDGGNNGTVALLLGEDRSLVPVFVVVPLTSCRNSSEREATAASFSSGRCVVNYCRHGGFLTKTSTILFLWC